MNGIAQKSLLALFVLIAGTAFGDHLSVSVTITGPTDEILPLLQHLKDLGVGNAAAKEGPAKLEITSVASSSSGAVAPPAPPPPPPKPPLAFLNLKAEPAALKAGGNFLLSVQASDPDHAVDTVAATIEGMPGTVELYDNGTHGDVKAADQIWSATVTLPPTVAPGDHPVAVKAFSAGGGPAMTKTGNEPPAPLTAQIKIAVQP